MAEHIYCGSGKEKKFDNEILSLSINLSELLAQFLEHGFTTEAGKKIIKLKVGRRRDVGKYGETHTVEIDTWKPDSSKSGIRPSQNPPSDGFPDDIPFN